MAIDLGRLKNKKTIILPIIGERDASRGILKGFTIVSSKDPVFRESQLEIDRTEEVCIQMDKDAQKDFTHRMTQEEYFRYRKNLVGSLSHRSDFNDALTTLSRLHQESGERQLRSVPFWKYQQWHSSASSSSSWWQWNDSW